MLYLFFHVRIEIFVFSLYLLDTQVWWAILHVLFYSFSLTFSLSFISLAWHFLWFATRYMVQCILKLDVFSITFMSISCIPRLKISNTVIHCVLHPQRGRMYFRNNLFQFINFLFILLRVNSDSRHQKIGGDESLEWVQSVNFTRNRLLLHPAGLNFLFSN